MLIISCEQEVSSTKYENSIHHGKMVVETYPPGAHIILDNNNTGKFTPDSLLYMEAGNYEIKLTKEYFLDTTFNISLEEHDTTLILVDYMNSPRNFAKIRCVSHPDKSLIFLDDSCTGKYTLDTLTFVWPGIHKLKYTHPEHRADSAIVTVYAGRNNNVVLFLQDTSEIINYMPNNSNIPTETLNSVAVDNNGVVWCGSYIGLIKYDEPNWILFDSLNSVLPSAIINTVNVDNKNRIWVGTSNGLAIIDGTDWKVYTSENSGLPHNSIKKIKFDSKGNTWLQASDMQTPGFIVKFDGVNWTYDTPDRTFLSFDIDNNDVAWVGSTYGLRKWENGVWTSGFVFDTDNVTNMYFNKNAIADIVIDSDGILWFVIEMNNVGNCKVFRLENNIAETLILPVYNPLIKKLYIDSNNVKWIITNTLKWSEIIKINPYDDTILYTRNDWNWTLYGFKDITSNNKGDIFVASTFHGLIKFKGLAL